MSVNWKDSIHRQRIELAGQLQDPMQRIAERLVPVWNDRHETEALLVRSFATIPYCTSVYALTTDGLQICDNIERSGVVPGNYERDRSHRPYMNEAVPAWGFLLSDAYISQYRKRPSLTALQIVRAGDHVLGYLGADFDLRDMPATAELYHEPAGWRQIKGDPAIRGQVFQQTRVESPMDQHAEQVFAILEEMLTERGVFQTQIHFSSSQATVWTQQDPYRYRILDIDALTDPDICFAYPRRAFPAEAAIPADKVAPILTTLHQLRHADENIYLRLASINLYNGMISLTFSCDGSHYMPYEEFLFKNMEFWLGTAA